MSDSLPGHRLLDHGDLDFSHLLKKERRVYGNWPVALWRELFRKSLSPLAGTTSIDILVQANGDGSTKLVFADNGAGMTEQMLRDVYFRPGTSIGGFGRSRILTCFSHRGYRIDTRDNLVLGGSFNPVDDNAARWALGKLSEPFNGCRITLDIAPKGSSEYDDADAADLRAALELYLSHSQLDCQVTVDGTPWTGPWMTRKRLASHLVDNEGRPFATVHALGADGPRTIVRVEGSLMFVDHTPTAFPFIIEVEPDRVPEVLGPTRDRMAPEFLLAYHRFLDCYATEHERKAPRTTMATVDVVPGALGHGLNQALPQAIAERLASMSGTLVETTYQDAETAAALHRSAVEAALGDVDPATAVRPRQPATMPALHDIHIHQDDATPLMRRALNRLYHPKNWLDAQGRLIPNTALKLHAVWRIACQMAVDAHLRVHGLDALEWGLGWLFDPHVRAEVHRTSAGMPVFLLNPVNDDGTLRFPISERDSWRDLLALAFHQAANIRHNANDPEFARELTRLIGYMDQKQAFRLMEDAIEPMRPKARRATRATTQPRRVLRTAALDSQIGIRPAERLAAGIDADVQEVAPQPAPVLAPPRLIRWLDLGADDVQLKGATVNGRVHYVLAGADADIAERLGFTLMDGLWVRPRDQGLDRACLVGLFPRLQRVELPPEQMFLTEDQLAAARIPGPTP